jgi:hypothetical protein
MDDVKCNISYSFVVSLLGIGIGKTSKKEAGKGAEKSV